MLFSGVLTRAGSSQTTLVGPMTWQVASIPLISLIVQFSSVAQLCLTLRPHELQHTRLPCS